MTSVSTVPSTNGSPRAAPGDGRVTAALPIPLTSFLGRDDEIAGVLALLDSGDTRLLTLTGPGGVGKTRLAIEVARRVEGDFADGSRFLRLAPIRDPSLVLPTLAQGIGVLERGDRPLLDAIMHELSDRHLLLVLDNFEHLLDVAPVWLADMLGACPRIKVLVTSRAALHIGGEHRNEVRPLPVPDADEETDFRESAAVMLFAQRARAVQPDFALDEAGIGMVAEICRRLEGLPLAIELAAARITVLPPAELLVRLSDRFALLGGGDLDAPARLRSLRDAIGWSYDLLTAAEQRLLRQLSVFVGGFTLEAAEAVTGRAALDDVASLVDKSLVRPVAGTDGAGRFLMLETIREFGLEQLAACGEEPATRNGHARWILSLARGTRADDSGLDQVLAIDRLEREHANIQAALRWLETSDQGDTLADLVTALEFHWNFDGHEVEGLGWYQSALAVPDLSTSMRLEGLGGAAVLAHNIGSPLAEGLIDELASQVEKTGTLRQRANASFILAMHAEDFGDYARAEAYFPVSRDYSDKVGDAWESIMCDYHLGVVALGQGTLDRALEILDGARSAAMRIDDPFIPAWSLVYQALIWCEREEPERAASLLRQHPDMNRTGFHQHEPLVRAAAGVVACQLGDHRRGARSPSVPSISRAGLSASSNSRGNGMPVTGCDPTRSRLNSTSSCPALSSLPATSRASRPPRCTT